MALQDDVAAVRGGLSKRTKLIYEQAEQGLENILRELRETQEARNDMMQMVKDLRAQLRAPLPDGASIHLMRQALEPLASLPCPNTGKGQGPDCESCTPCGARAALGRGTAP